MPPIERRCTLHRVGRSPFATSGVCQPRNFLGATTIPPATSNITVVGSGMGAGSKTRGCRAERGRVR